MKGASLLSKCHSLRNCEEYSFNRWLFLSSSFSNATLPLIQCPTLRQSQCLYPQTFRLLAFSRRLVNCLTAVHPREALAMLMKAVPERAQLSVHTLHPQVGAEIMSLAYSRALHRDQYTTMRLNDFSHTSSNTVLTSSLLQ